MAFIPDSADLPLAFQARAPPTQSVRRRQKDSQFQFGVVVHTFR